MNYEEIIERLLDEKHITAKEAIYLLQLCSKQPQYVPYWPTTYQPTTSQPEITCKPDTTSITDGVWVRNPYGYSTN